MIHSLHIRNLRRIAAADLTFTSDDQLIVVDGPNGSGKSTLIAEALLWALYGEGREGRRHLERLVRRGAGNDGVTVAIGFDIDGVDHTVTRRRDRQHTTATLAINGMPAVEGAGAVTQAVTRLLGMDAASFRIGVLAMQGELDGFTRLRPAERAQAVSRLLRLQLLGRARDIARCDWRASRDALAAAGSPPDLVALTEAHRTLADHLAASVRALAASCDAIAALDTEIAELEPRRLERTAAATRLQLAADRLAGAVERADTIEARLATIVVPPVPEMPAGDPVTARALLVEAEATVGAVASALTRADELAGRQRRLDMLEHGLTERLTALPHADTERIAKRLHHLRETCTGLVELVAERRAAVRAAEGARERLTPAARLDGTCDRCGQPVSEEWLTQLEAQHTTAVTAAAVAVDVATGLLRSAEQELLSARQTVDGAAAAYRQAEQTESERRELTAQLDALRAERARLGEAPSAPCDASQARARLDAARTTMARWDAHHAAVTAAAAAGAQRAELAHALTAHRRQIAILTEEHTAAAIAPCLQDAVDRLDTLVARRTEEATLHTALEIEVAGLRERAEAAEARVTDATERLTHRSTLERAGRNAEAAGRLLDRALEARAHDLVPRLAAACSELLALLSAHRFEQVTIDATYDVRVVDDGQPRALGELSGGEQDLVALALRLALAELAGGRRRGLGGLVVLDEVFGSQDTQRRDALVTGLRALRARYGQILACSHVGSLDDAADTVVELALGEVDGERCSVVTVS